MAVVLNVYLVLLTAKLVLQLAVNPGVWTINLFVNFWNPTEIDTINNYVVCSWPGYASSVLQPAEWTGGIQRVNAAEFQYPLLTWTFDPSSQAQQTVYGYFLTDITGNVLYSELFPAPYPIPAGGGTLPLILTWSDQQC